MVTGRKQITFDLDTKALQKYYPGESWNNAYEVIKKHMLKNNFVWLQGSVYVSREPLCMRDCRETNIGKEHSKNHVFDKAAEMKPRSLPL
ncbi:MAG: hypothetical protein K2N87_08630 [Eubacterium sp.]|nr:hypothetical protein [Eubacterium sp.]